MKISTDAILLGSSVEFSNPQSILDIGTGTGVVALMLAQRFPESKVLAVEIDEDAAMQALENFRESQFSERLSLWKGRFQDLDLASPVELIVSNPPYFPDHLKSSDPKRNKALHTDELSFEDLISKAQTILAPQGQLWVILPPRQMQDFVAEALAKSLYRFKSIEVRDRQGAKVMREICGFSFAAVDSAQEEVVLKEQDGTYTSAYQRLLSGFLLGY